MNDLNSLLESVLPDHGAVTDLIRRAAEINSYYVSNEISAADRDSLMMDLVNTRVIISEDSKQDRAVLAGQVFKILCAVPIP
jgi:hypothetical protein